MTIALIVIAALVVFAAVTVVATLRRSDADSATGRLSRETHPATAAPSRSPKLLFP